MGAGFKLYRAAETGPNNSAIYYSIFNPAISGAEYEPITVLSEDHLTGPPANGDEVRALYADYSEALAPGGATLETVADRGIVGAGDDAGVSGKEDQAAIDE